MTQRTWTIAKRLLPWAVSVGLLAYLAATTDLSRVADAFRRVPLLPLAGMALGGTLLAFVYDSTCLMVLLRRFNAPVGFREVTRIKGASYLLNIINYNAAMGGMAVYFWRVRKVSFLETASSLLFMNALDVFVLCGFIALGLGLAGDTLGAVLAPEARHGLLLVLAAFGAILIGCWLYWNAGFDFFVLGRLRSWRVFHAFRQARLVDWGVLALLRAGIVLLYVIITYAYARLFGIPLPFVAVLALQPIITFVGTVPVSVAGLGTTQVVMRAFYGGFAAYLGLQPAADSALAVLSAPAALVPGAPLATPAVAEALRAATGAFFDPTSLVDAYSTGMILSIVLVRIGIGYVYLRRVSGELADARLAEGSGENGTSESAPAG